MVDHLAIAKRTPPVAESKGAVFAQLYQQHIDAVFNYCLYRVGDVAVAEDLTADVFERAWSARHRYNSGRASFSTWLLTIARRRVIDWQRSQGRRHIVELDERVPSPLPGPDVLAQEAEEQHRLQRLIRSLPRDAQDLLAMI
jgi:RNA polymerase sigma-70 factor (ECF subfamily)